MLFTNRPTPNAIAEQGPEVDFDSLLSEMNHIEGKSLYQQSVTVVV